MIADTSAFLTWALPRAHRLPRVPVRPVRDGGFSALNAIPGATERVARWWAVSLDTLARRMNQP